MLSEQDKTLIIQTARQYGANQVLLFGSSTDTKREARDIDIAVAGIPAKRFFKFYGELLFKVSKPLDIIDLEQSNAFTRMVREEGIVLYEQA